MQQILVLALLLAINPVSAHGFIKAKASSHCAITKNLNIDDLANQAGIIFRGKLQSIQYKEVDGLERRELTFTVSDPIKGVNSKTITLSEWAASRSPFVDKVIKNKPYVFFFHSPSEIGLTSLIGMEQGLVSIDRNNRIKFSNRVSMQKTKRGLFRQKLVQMKLDDYQSLKDFCSQ